jgi:hypothetical protein
MAKGTRDINEARDGRFLLDKSGGESVRLIVRI